MLLQAANALAKTMRNSLTNLNMVLSRIGARLCGLEEIGSLVVDSDLAEEHRAMLDAAGVAIHLAPVGEGRTNGAIVELARADGAARIDGVGIQA